MSDNWIILIPEDPQFVPSKSMERRAVSLFKEFAPAADRVTAKTSEKIRFIDCGANLEQVFCPDCKGEIPMDWYRDRMEEEFFADYPLLPHNLPCCGVARSLGQLDYYWPQGLARFSVEAMNPNIGDLTDEQVKAFELALGCPIRKILVHI